MQFEWLFYLIVFIFRYNWMTEAISSYLYTIFCKLCRLLLNIIGLNLQIYFWNFSSECYDAAFQGRQQFLRLAQWRLH